MNGDSCNFIRIRPLPGVITLSSMSKVPVLKNGQRALSPFSRELPQGKRRGGTGVGLKHWLGKNVAGASGYGNTMGREVVKNGIALGRTLYLGHGVRGPGSDSIVFEDSAEMLAAGFTPYCSGPANRPVEDASDLSKHLSAVGITFAYKCATTAAFNFMKVPNATSFSRSTVQYRSGVSATQFPSDLCIA